MGRPTIASSLCGQHDTRRGRHDCRIVICGLQRQPRVLLHKVGFLRSHRVVLAEDLTAALRKVPGLLARHDGAQQGPN